MLALAYTVRHTRHIFCPITKTFTNKVAFLGVKSIALSAWPLPQGLVPVQEILRSSPVSVPALPGWGAATKLGRVHSHGSYTEAHSLTTPVWYRQATVTGSGEARDPSGPAEAPGDLNGHAPSPNTQSPQDMAKYTSQDTPFRV